MKKYTQLSLEDRVIIYTLTKAGYSMRKVAKEVGKHCSTIIREVSRNFGKKGYRYKQAHRMSTLRKKHAFKAIKLTKILIEKIEEMIKEDWSPEQVSGALKKKGVNISHERIYQHIYDNKKHGGSLWKHLRHGNKKRKNRDSKENRGVIKNKVSIHERPQHVEQNIEFGHWEVDLISGKGHKGFMVTLVERVTKKTLTQKVPNKKASTVTQVIIKLLSPYKQFVLSITSDNGKEFAWHEIIQKTLKTLFFFADPYASWQRGLNENTNGLIRQYLPKKTCFKSVTNDMVEIIQNKLNQRPRKSLGFLTPFQVFNQEVVKKQRVALIT